MNGDLLVDSDVLIDHLRGARRFEPGEAAVSYSVLTRADLLGGRHVDEGVVERLLEPMRELPIERPIAERAGRLRRGTGMHFVDALVAATALEHRLALLTRNRRHFEDVRGLTLA